MIKVKTLKEQFALLMLPHHRFVFQIEISSLPTFLSVSLNDGAFMKVSSIIEQQFPKDDPSPSNNLSFPFSFQTHSMPFHGILSLNSVFNVFVLVVKRLNWSFLLYHIREPFSKSGRLEFSFSYHMRA
jgi:hypothetical protein